MSSSMDFVAMEAGSEGQLGPKDAAYWPMWVNITVPLLSALAFAGVQALLLFVDDPGLRSAKRAGLYPRPLAPPPTRAPAAAAATSAAVYVEMEALPPPPARPQPAAAAAASGIDAAVQCDLFRPVPSGVSVHSSPALWPHHQPPPQHQSQQSLRQRTVSFGAMEVVGNAGLRQRSGSETMRMLEGMLLRPGRRHTHQHQQQAYLHHAAEIDQSRTGGAAIFEESPAAAAPAAQSLTGPSGRRLMHSIHHYYQQHQQQRLQARQLRYSTPVQPDRRALSEEYDRSVPPTPPSSDRGDD